MTIKIFRSDKMGKRLIFRLPNKMYEQVSKFVETGNAKNRSELIRMALKEFLSKEVSKDE